MSMRSTVLPHTAVSSRSCQPDRREDLPLKSAAEASTLRRYHLRMVHGSPIGRIHAFRNQVVEVGAPPITINPSGLLEEFVLYALSLSFKVLAPGKPVLPSKDIVIIPVTLKL